MLYVSHHHMVVLLEETCEPATFCYEVAFQKSSLKSLVAESLLFPLLLTMIPLQHRADTCQVIQLTAERILT